MSRADEIGERPDVDGDRPPRLTSKIIGHDAGFADFTQSRARGRLHHSWLLSGIKGIGKASFAYQAARHLLLNTPTDTPVHQPLPDTNPAMRLIVGGVHPDLFVLARGYNHDTDKFRTDIPVDGVRRMKSFFQLSSADGNWRVCIIDSLDEMNKYSLNSLLKILEEPPEHVKFVFATTEAHKVLPTIVSRCQRFDLKPIPENLIKDRLAYICEQEEISAEDTALQAIARMADGGMRDSQSILDQMIAFCGESIAEEDVLQVYGLVGAEQTADLATAIATGDHIKILELVDSFDSSGRDFFRALVDLQARVREALLEAVKAGGTGSSLGAPMTTESLTRLLDSLRQSESALKFGLNEKVNFEVALLKASEECRARAIDGLIRELSGIAAGLPEEKKKP